MVAYTCMFVLLAATPFCHSDPLDDLTINLNIEDNNSLYNHESGPKHESGPVHESGLVHENPETWPAQRVTVAREVGDVTEFGDSRAFILTTVEAVEGLAYVNEVEDHELCCQSCNLFFKNTQMYNWRKAENYCYCYKNKAGVEPKTKKRNAMISGICVEVCSSTSSPAEIYKSGECQCGRETCTDGDTCDYLNDEPKCVKVVSDYAVVVVEAKLIGDLEESVAKVKNDVAELVKLEESGAKVEDKVAAIDQLEESAAKVDEAAAVVEAIEESGLKVGDAAVVAKEVAALEVVKESAAKVEQEAAVLEAMEESGAKAAQKAGVIDEIKKNGAKVEVKTVEFEEVVHESMLS